MSLPFSHFKKHKVSEAFNRTPLFFTFIDITSQVEYTYTYENGNTYSYDSIWKDRLNYYNGVALTYDEQGNPLTYLGHSLTWEKGRRTQGKNTGDGSVCCKTE